MASPSTKRPDALLNWSEAAEALGITERHLRGLWQKRMIAAVKVGQLVKFPPDAIDQYIDRHRVEAVR
jgi:excisionase family DNA binding protein